MVRASYRCRRARKLSHPSVPVRAPAEAEGASAGLDDGAWPRPASACRRQDASRSSRGPAPALGATGRGGERRGSVCAVGQLEHRHRLHQRCACRFRLSAAAALSSTSAAFCCVAWSIWLTASPTCATPALCSALAALISPMMSVTRLIDVTTSFIVAPAWSTSAVPCSTRSTLALIRLLISLAASATALRQAAHLAGDHRKAAALLAGARRFHRRVQRQDVGLEGDAVDDADDVGDLAASCR